MKITKLETMRLPEFPLSCFLFVHTDAGIVGLGESTNLAGSIEGALHDVIVVVKTGKPHNLSSDKDIGLAYWLTQADAI